MIPLVAAVLVAAAPPLPTLPQSAEIELRVERDGALSVTEAVAATESMTRELPLRQSVGGDEDRVLTVRDVVVEGDGHAELTADSFKVELSGTAVVRYTVDGAITASPTGPQVSWPLAQGWSEELKFVRASLAAPKIPEAVRCVAGPKPCLAAQIDHVGLTRFSHRNLPPGERMMITVELPPGSVPANERLVPSATIGGAFLLTEPVGWAWVALGFLILCWAWLIAFLRQWWPRPAAGAPPGYAGVLADGRADAMDAALTLAALRDRGHLAVSDGTLTRTEAGDPLREFERDLLEQVFASREQERREAAVLDDVRIDLHRFERAVRADLRADGLLRTTRLRRAGIRIVFYGLFLTALLALTVGYAQLGVVLSVAGVALALGSAALPARTVKGTRALGGLADDYRPGAADEFTLAVAGRSHRVRGNP
ncbi:DUF2207 domain-containing protein [Amycolatopsis albispora]|uniref:DUF2207 domain-containing protein n=1 Tax=Amycolatopsis albispora TaxID=1804986 RepID=A0A344LGL6_9PSEU|nr:DUF2207 domain-containing protein [Amycolatopsis albispora]AXB47190.1 hypothetical protein A4R43_36020 [Amycolatopsis albispora]